MGAELQPHERRLLKQAIECWRVIGLAQSAARSMLEIANGTATADRTEIDRLVLRAVKYTNALKRALQQEES